MNKKTRNIGAIVCIVSGILLYTANEMKPKPSIPAELHETKLLVSSIKIVPREPTIGGIPPYYEGIDNWKHPTMEIKIKKVE